MPLIEGIALPAMLVAVGVGIWAAGLGPHAVDLLYRVDIGASTGRGSPALALFGIVLISFGQVMLLMRAGMEAALRLRQAGAGHPFGHRPDDPA